MRNIFSFLLLVCFYQQTICGVLAEDDELDIPYQLAEEEYEYGPVSDTKNYTIRDTIKVTWFQAQVLCSIEDMKLASIVNAADMNNLFQSFFNDEIEYNDFWLSGNNFSGAWAWPAQQSNFTAFSKWAKNEPKNVKEKGSCLVMQSNLRWKVSDCEQKYYYICEQ